MEPKLVVSILVVLLSILIYCMLKAPHECDMSSPSNRDFNVYYGLENGKNPFGVLSAEHNKNAPLFEPVITENMKSASLILVGETGSGKTHIREYRLSKYDTQKTIIIKLFGNNINKYLDIFVQNIDTQENNHEKLARNFNKADLMHIILSELVENIISLNNENHISYIKKLKFDDKLKISYLLSFYSRNDRPDGILKLINELLSEKTKCWTCSSIDTKHCKTQEYDYIRSRFEDKHEYLKIKNLFENVRVLSKDQKNDAALLLYCIMEKTGFQPKFLSEKSEFMEITVLSKFLKDVYQKKLILLVDSLDENLYFFDEKGTPYTQTFQAFINSLIYPEVMALALGNHNEVVFDILVFIPLLENITINWNRVDKIPIVNLKWNHLDLFNYADFIASHLNKMKYNGCKAVPSFGKLLNSTSIALDVLKQLRQPRDLHIFMINLIKVMNDNALHRDQPFIATKEDVDVSLAQARKQMFKKNN